MREEVAAFIEARDGVGPADPESIFLTDGASAGVRMTYTTMIDSSSGARLLTALLCQKVYVSGALIRLAAKH